MPENLNTTPGYVYTCYVQNCGAIIALNVQLAEVTDNLGWAQMDDTFVCPMHNPSITQDVIDSFFLKETVDIRGGAFRTMKPRLFWVSFEKEPLNPHTSVRVLTTEEGSGGGSDAPE